MILAQEAERMAPHFVPTSLRTAIAIRNPSMDEAANEHHIESLVAAEPATGAAILRLANSALHYRGTPCTSLWGAMLVSAMRRCGTSQPLWR